MNTDHLEDTAAGSVIRRVTTLLRVIGAAVPAGLSTTEAAKRAGVNRSTTHRLLNALAEEGFLDRDRERGTWFLGPEIHLLGGLAAERYDISHLAAERLRVLAELTGESAYLSARRGFQTVCLLEREGSFPLRSLVLHPGVRFPLGVASAGMAVLAFLPEQEVDTYLRDGHLERDHGSIYADSEIRRRIVETRRLGYSLNPGLVLEGSWGVGAAVFDGNSRPAWALSLTGVESRIRDRQEYLGTLLLQQAHLLGQDLRTRAEGLRPTTTNRISPVNRHGTDTDRPSARS